MSELPKTRLNNDPIPSDERYRAVFGELPLQATLNMLDAYQPQGSTRDIQGIRYAMEYVRVRLLASGQESGGVTVNLSGIEDEVLQRASEQVWCAMDPEIAQRYRTIGANVIPIVGYQSA